MPDDRTFILNDIEFVPDENSLLEKLRLKGDESHARDFHRLVVEALDLVRPKAAYRLDFIESSGEDFVLVQGLRFSSRVLRVNLSQTHRLFPYTATCGTELALWEGSKTDLMERYWADVIENAALRTAIMALREDLARRFQTGRLSSMSPGSLEDWPLSQQRPLFQLIGPAAESIGLQLTESMFMKPRQSVSGVLFESEHSFVNCQLCPRQSCPGRRAPYDEGLYERRYRR